MTRITVVEQVAYQQEGESPTSIESHFSRWLESTEQPYQRRLTVGPDWLPLDRGWLHQYPRVLFLLRNDGGPPVQRVLSIEETRRRDELTVEIGACFDSEKIPVVQVRSGESCRFELGRSASLYLRCPTGESRILITLFPE